MSGLYIVSNGAEYFIPSPDDFSEVDESQDEDTVLQGVDRLGEQISEFLNCFQLFGYDAKGRPVKLTRMSSYMEYAAITGLIRDEIEKDEMEKWATMDIIVGEDDDCDDEIE